MKLRILAIALLALFFAPCVKGQDIVITKDSRIIRCAVTSLNEQAVSYRMQGQSDINTIDIDAISVIRFRDEEKWKNLPDNLVIGRIDDLYGALTRADAGKNDESSQKLQVYYSALPPVQRERIKKALIGRISEEYNSNSDSLVPHLEEILALLPKNEPGRDVLFRVSASVYKSRNDADALGRVLNDFDEYETLTGKSFPKTREAIISALSYVDKVSHFEDELLGMWVSEERTGAYGSPKYVLVINKTESDSLTICFFHGLDGLEYDKYSSPHSNYAQMFSVNGPTQEYSFTFSSKRYSNGNVALAESAVILGSAISSSLAQSDAMRYGTVYGSGNSTVMLASALAAKLAEVSTRIDIMKLYGQRLSTNVFQSHILVERTVVRSLEPLPERNLLEDLSVKWYRIPPGEAIHFFDKQGRWFGQESTGWSDDDFKMHRTDFQGSEEFRMFHESYPAMASEKSFVKVRKAFNQYVYERLSAR